MFKQLLGITEDVVKTVAAPLEAGLEVVRTVTKPIADTVEEGSRAVGETARDLRDD